MLGIAWNQAGSDLYPASNRFQKQMTPSLGADIWSRPPSDDDHHYRHADQSSQHHTVNYDYALHRSDSNSSSRPMPLFYNTALPPMATTEEDSPSYSRSGTLERSRFAPSWRTPERTPPIQQDVSPTSARSGPESPDPLNILSPVRSSDRQRRESGSPLGHVKLSHTLKDTNRSGGTIFEVRAKASRPLEEAMGASLRPTLRPAMNSHLSKRRLESDVKISDRPVQQRLSSPGPQDGRRKKSRQSQGPSPIRADSFYAAVGSKSSSVSSRGKAQGRKSEAIVASSGPTGLVQPSATACADRLQTLVDGSEASRQQVLPKGLGLDEGNSATATARSSVRLSLPPKEKGNIEEDIKRESPMIYHTIDEYSNTANAQDMNPSSVPEYPDLLTLRAPPPTQPTSTSVKPSRHSSAKSRLLEFTENILEAESGLPDRDALAGMEKQLPPLCQEFFVNVDDEAVIKPTRLLEFSRLLRAALSSGKNRLRTDAHFTEYSSRQTSTGLDMSEGQSLLRVLQPTLVVGEGIHPFPIPSSESLLERQNKKSKRTEEGLSPMRSRRKSTSCSAKSSSVDPERASEDRITEQREVREEEDEDMGVAPNDDESMGEKTKDLKRKSRTGAAAQASSDGIESNANTATQQDHLIDQLSRIATGLMAAECCLLLVCGEDRDHSVASEQIVSCCLTQLRQALEQVVYPFIEACAHSGASVHQHPLLTIWLMSLASHTEPKKGTKKKKTGQDSARQAEVSPQISKGFRTCSDYLAAIFQHSCSCLTLAEGLVQTSAVSLTESMIFSTVYLGIGTFFVSEPDTSTSPTSSENGQAALRGKKAMESLTQGTLDGAKALHALRLPALNLLRNIFARHTAQRQWIIEEILSSLMKLPDMKKNRRQYHLRSGGAINSITALLLQLIQAASHGIKDRLPSSAPLLHENLTTGLVSGTDPDRPSTQNADQPIVDEIEDDPQHNAASPAYDLSFLRKALDGPGHAAFAIASFLMGKVSQTKVVKASGDFSYAAVVENLVIDLLQTALQPEWPASLLLIASLCRSFDVVLEDPHASTDAKNLALEHTGTVAAFMRASALSLEASRSSSEVEAKSNLARPTTLATAEAVWETSLLNTLNRSYLQTVEHLAATSVVDETFRSALEFIFAQWAAELSASLVRTSSALEQAKASSDADARSQQTSIDTFLSTLHQSLLLLAAHGQRLMVDAVESRSLSSGGCHNSDNLARTYEELTHTVSYGVSFEFLSSMIASSLHAQAVGNRTKALRALSVIYDVDVGLLNPAPVREAIETRLSDESAGVREAAVSMLTKYILRQPDDTQAMYQKLAERIYDAGLAVRKRTLKLLASIYRFLSSQEMRTDACIRMVRCIGDEDTGVQNIALQTLKEIWLGAGASNCHDEADQACNLRQAESEIDHSTANATPAFDLSDDVATIVAVTGAIRERPSPMEEVFRRFAHHVSEEDGTDVRDRLRAISDSLIASLEQQQDVEGGCPLTLARIRTLYLVVSTNPSVMSINKAKSLLSHLRGGRQTSEQASVCELLLKVLRISLPLMPKTALAFAKQLDGVIRPWFNSPPMHASTLQEFIHCYVTNVRCHTGDYDSLIRTFGQLIKAVRAIRNKLATTPNAAMDVKYSLLMSQMALLAEKADFDAMVKEMPHLSDKVSIATGSKTTVKDLVFKTLLDVRQANSTYSATALRNIGYLFRGFPLLMISEEGMGIMDEVFAHGRQAEAERLLKIIVEFLTVDAERRAPEQVATTEPVSKSVGASKRLASRKASLNRPVDMTELVGDTDTFADSGIGSILVQRYLTPILEAAVAVETPAVQRSALDILKFIVMQGLSHPLQCVPTLISLETLDDRGVSVRALQLHEHLANKHASILAARYSELIRSAFDFQLKMHRENTQSLRGYRIDPTSGCPTALLSSWYSLLREKRQTRLDFVKSLSRMLDIDTSAGECTEATVLLTRFVADNMATLDYKTVEEVFVAAAEIKRILSVAGAQVKFIAEEIVADAECVMTGIDGQEASLASDEGEDGEDDFSDVPDDDYLIHKGVSRETQMELDEARLGSRPRRGEEQVRRGHAPHANQVKASKQANAARMSVAMGTAMLLRDHLKRLYGLSESRCSKYQPGKKLSSGADRPAVKRDPAGSALSFDAMSLAFDSMEPASVSLQQLAMYEEMVDAEEALAEDPDDWDE